MREADARDAQKDEEEEEEEEESRARSSRSKATEVPEKIVLTPPARMYCWPDVRKLALETDFEPEEWSLRMPYDNFVLTLARTAERRGRIVRAATG